MINKSRGLAGPAVLHQDDQTGGFPLGFPLSRAEKTNLAVQGLKPQDIAAGLASQGPAGPVTPQSFSPGIGSANRLPPAPAQPPALPRSQPIDRQPVTPGEESPDQTAYPPDPSIQEPRPVPLFTSDAIRKFEGEKRDADGMHVAYPDDSVKKGKWAVGRGHQVTLDDLRSGGRNVDALLKKHDGDADAAIDAAMREEPLRISDDKANELLTSDLRNTTNQVDSMLRQLNINPQSLSRAQHSALVQMAYQMGVSGLRGFRKMLAALRSGDGKAAYKEALDSKWAKDQTPRRAQEVAALLREEGGGIA